MKFAGDALLVVWGSLSETDSNLESFTFRCIQCALQIQKEVDGFSPAANLVLRIRSAIAAGHIYGLHVGGASGKREYIIKGQPLQQIQIASNIAQSGQIVLSAESYKLVMGFVTGLEVHNGCFLLNGISPKMNIPIVPMTLHSVLKTKLEEKYIKMMLKTYIPNSILPRLESGLVKFLAELRTVCHFKSDLFILDINAIYLIARD